MASAIHGYAVSALLLLSVAVTGCIDLDREWPDDAGWELGGIPDLAGDSTRPDVAGRREAGVDAPQDAAEDRTAAEAGADAQPDLALDLPLDKAAIDAGKDAGAEMLVDLAPDVTGPDLGAPDVTGPDLGAPDVTGPDLGVDLMVDSSTSDLPPQDVAPPAPLGKCATAKAISLKNGKVSVKGDTSSLLNEFSALTCVGSLSLSGPQAYYRVPLTGGETYKISPQPGFDAYFYIFPSSAGCKWTAIEAACASKGTTGDVSALVKKGSQGGLAFKAPVTAQHIIAVDSGGTSQSGSFTLSLELDCSKQNDQCNSGVNVSGSCIKKPKLGGTTCSDGDSCTQNDKCQVISGVGVCKGTCSGCCQGGSCVAGNTPQACGTGGKACVACSPGATCVSGACVSPSCGPGNCAGCCQGTLCITSTGASACGKGGATCTTCKSYESCQGGACAFDDNHIWTVSIEWAIIDNSKTWDSVLGFVTPPDPFVVLTVGNTTGKTKTSNDTWKPGWNQQVLSAAAGDLTKNYALKVTVYDDDSFLLGTQQSFELIDKCNLNLTPAVLMSGAGQAGCGTNVKKIQFSFKY